MKQVLQHVPSAKPAGQVAASKVTLTFEDGSSVKEACKMLRRKQSSILSFQPFALVHPQTLGRLH